MNVFNSFIGPANVYVQYSSQQEENNAYATISDVTTNDSTAEGATPTQPTSFQWSAPPPSYNNVMETTTTKWHYSISLTFLWWLQIHMNEIKRATDFYSLVWNGKRSDTYINIFAWKAERYIDWFFIVLILRISMFRKVFDHKMNIQNIYLYWV